MNMNVNHMNKNAYVQLNWWNECISMDSENTKEGTVCLTLFFQILKKPMNSFIT